MPHFTIEYSANLDGVADMTTLCREVLKTALASGVFETRAVRVRAMRCSAYAIADEARDNSNAESATGRCAVTLPSIAIGGA